MRLHRVSHAARICDLPGHILDAAVIGERLIATGVLDLIVRIEIAFFGFDDVPGPVVLGQAEKGFDKVCWFLERRNKLCFDLAATLSASR